MAKEAGTGGSEGGLQVWQGEHPCLGLRGVRPGVSHSGPGGYEGPGLRACSSVI